MPDEPTVLTPAPHAYSPPQPIRVTSWHTEKPLFGALLLVSLLIWTALVLSMVGIFYAAIIAFALFLSHAVFVTTIRGSAIRLGPEQLPELHARVVELSRRSGLKAPPEAYLMESGGQLNAFATRFLGRPMMVLYSDLLEACESNEQARDMIIGHELGHIRAGHLRWLWILAPGMAVPFLGAAYSRARELTCDRWGMALCGDREAAVRGLTVLAAGKKSAPEVNLEAFVAQARDLDTGWMTLGRWLSSYPPLCERVAQLDPGLFTGSLRTGKGAVLAFALMGGITVLPALAVGGVMAAIILPMWTQALGQMDTLQGDDEGIGELGEREESRPTFESVEEFEAARQQAALDLEDLLGVLERHVETTGELPSEIEEVETTWETTQSRPFPVDPFDGFPYGYSVEENSQVVLWSSGPDGESLTGDDIRLRGAVGP